MRRARTASVFMAALLAAAGGCRRTPPARGSVAGRDAGLAAGGPTMGAPAEAPGDDGQVASGLAPPTRDDGSATRARARPARLVSFAGEVRIGAAGDARAVAAARASNALEDDAPLEVGEGGRATVRLPDGRQLELRPGTRLRLARGKSGALEVRLEAGALVARASAPSIAIDVLTPFGITRLPAGASDVTVAVNASRAVVTVAVGAVTFVDRDGAHVRIAADERIEVSVAGVQILPAHEPRARAAAERRAPAPPALPPPDFVETDALPPSPIVLPTARALRVYGGGVRTVTLSWPQATPGDAEVEVARDPEFVTIERRARARGGRLTVRAPARGALHWRVRRPGAERPLVGDARFLADADAGGARAGGDMRLRNVVSETGEKATVHFQSALPALTLAFAETPGAASYRVRLYGEADLGTPRLERTVAEPRCALPAGAVGEGRWLWGATPLDAAGRELGGGRLNKLELAYDNAASRLEIASPRRGQIVRGARVEVAGVAPLGSTLFVNGQPARLDGKGRFALEVDRAPALVFRLVARDGAEAFWIRLLGGRS